jgi:esterase FrsA
VTELWPFWQVRAKAGIYPFQYTLADDVQSVLAGLDSYDRDV